ncbi:MAG TPA: ribosomal protein S18-alanine N-acetyltransferase [Candidatus Aminicenantes bacterium]|nr:ribosomal protein S18-alanine N-acetyltransferase [Candidatus Aminicenantes bacterium]HRY65062.1 ribosomal protein S18-alanine N-acetyltransferase [Candidatus Aminicenantes bacterium]HRZ71975.1 ribosomal protein S18-alanine N-acetyltransferase [Candidatus Aminicenantes bacterium]
MSNLTGEGDRFFIRRMKESDLAAVRGIETLSFSNPWSDNTFRGEIQNTSVSFPLVVVRRPGETVVGYIIYWQIRDDVQVNNIAVHPDCRGLGLGEALLRHAIARTREAGAAFMTLEVRPSNTPALTLYKKLGFEVMGVRKNYYTKPDEDAYVMALVLA